MDLFDILMIIALGTLAGTMIGLVIGYAAHRQRYRWALMTHKEKLINGVLVLFFSAVCIAGLAWYELV
jgi:membrane protein YqaA with SNARE-associated domain